MLEKAIPRLLDIAEEYSVPFTFFLCGEVAENCSHLFSDLKDHLIGVHTHPFTHRDIFRGSSPNDREEDYLASYNYDQQKHMISRDYHLIKENLNIDCSIFRAGKHSVNNSTFKALDDLGFNIDCSLHPPFQLVGWQPFKIKNTSLWEIPTYSDISPEIIYNVIQLFKASSFSKNFFDGTYVGIIHPMTLGNPDINTDLLFKNFEKMITVLDKMGYEFRTITESFEKRNFKSNICNNIGKTINYFFKPFHQLIKNNQKKSALME